jgi:hypothetical protein
MWWEVGDSAWEFAPNVYKSEDGRDIIHRYCDGVAKAWNATAVSAHEYAPTDRVVVIVCNMGYLTFIDIYRKQRNWEVLRRQILSCNDIPYVIPVVKRVLAREGFDNAMDIVNCIVERWVKLLQLWAQL